MTSGGGGDGNCVQEQDGAVSSQHYAVDLLTCQAQQRVGLEALTLP